MIDIRQSAIGNRQSRAFTLVEMLLVIGIILILISILVPTVTRVRIAAQTASTRQMFSRIEAGISQYYTDFQAYPGPFANTQVGTAAGITTWTIDGATGGTTNLTSTENMVLGVVGGLRVTAGPALQAVFTSTSMPTGPASLNTVNPKKYPGYVNVEAVETTAVVAPRFFPGNTKGLGGSSDTIVPEIMDKFSNPMPILYLRANRGSTGFVSTATNNTVQYNFGHLAPYGFTTINTTDFQAHANDGSLAGSYRYFGNTAVSGVVPYMKDTYILISAGADGKYGTNDDITNFRSNN